MQRQRNKKENKLAEHDMHDIIHLPTRIPNERTLHNPINVKTGMKKINRGAERYVRVLHTQNTKLTTYSGE